MSEFIEARNDAVQRAVVTQAYQPFYEFCCDWDIRIEIACPRDKMAMVMFLWLVIRSEDTELVSIYQTVLTTLRNRGYDPLLRPYRMLVNKETNKVIEIPPSLLRE